MTDEERAELAKLTANLDLSNFQPRPMPTGLLAAATQTNQQLLGDWAALASGIMPPSYNQAPNPLPWWFQMGVPVAGRETAPPAPATATATATDPVWGPIEAASSARENITNNLGDFGRRVMSSPLVTGEW